MQIVPTIDISQGKCVRLKQGNIDEKTVYPEDPLTYAHKWEAAGAGRLHIVDLDAAHRQGDNCTVIKKIVRATSVHVQVGGGIRSVKAADFYFSRVGVSRLVIGTAAVIDPKFLSWAATWLKEALVVDVAAKNGIVTIDGWRKSTGIPARELMLMLAGVGVQRIIYTDTARDGMLEGPNFREIEKVVQYAQSLTNPIKVCASGGISSIADLLWLKRVGVDEALLGKALYENKIDLGEAIATCA